MGIECDPYADSTSRSQRKWIYQRDDFCCQLPKIYIPIINSVIRICGNQGADVHHIWPKRALMYTAAQDPHTPYNLIVLCRYHHWLIHPDLTRALYEKKMGNKNALEELFERRRALLNKGEAYWNTTWDEILKEIAKKRTAEFFKRFPQLAFPKSYVSAIKQAYV